MKVFEAKNTMDRKKEIYEYLGLNTPNTIPVQVKADLSLLGISLGSFVVVDRSIINPKDGQLVFCTTNMTTYPIIRRYSKNNNKIGLSDGITVQNPKECTIYGIVIAIFTKI